MAADSRPASCRHQPPSRHLPPSANESVGLVGYAVGDLQKIGYYL